MGIIGRAYVARGNVVGMKFRLPPFGPASDPLSLDVRHVRLEVGYFLQAIHDNMRKRGATFFDIVMDPSPMVIAS